ncbi:hypothetical protein GQR58_009909 [Nymphon striatum]|nr:hypothetical protein GQR58_009909 [Nymphon striatum]
MVAIKHMVSHVYTICFIMIRIDNFWIFSKLFVYFILTIMCKHQGSCHGRLLDPPGRSTMWRLGYPTPSNYDDNQLYCGGKYRQWLTYGGMCGPCGDSWGESDNGKYPRPNEAGGKYGTGLIGRSYEQGSTINSLVQLTASHLGFFEFQLCPTNNKTIRSNDICFTSHPIQIKGRSDFRYYVDQGSVTYNISLELPEDLVCDQCVFLWRYQTGNSYGKCLNGSRLLGCGPQEEFRGCADVRIFRKTPSTITVSNNYISSVCNSATSVFVENNQQCKNFENIFVSFDEICKNKSISSKLSCFSYKLQTFDLLKKCKETASVLTNLMKSCASPEMPPWKGAKCKYTQ